MPFIDADEEIERAAGKSIEDIFADHGEPYFATASGGCWPGCCARRAGAGDGRRRLHERGGRARQSPRAASPYG
ncbi:MAG: shikimate kinase [Hyphomicrobium sp.]